VSPVGRHRQSAPRAWHVSATLAWASVADAPRLPHPTSLALDGQGQGRLSSAHLESHGLTLLAAWTLHGAPRAHDRAARFGAPAGAGDWGRWELFARSDALAVRGGQGAQVHTPGLSWSDARVWRVSLNAQVAHADDANRAGDRHGRCLPGEGREPQRGRGLQGEQRRQRGRGRLERMRSGLTQVVRHRRGRIRRHDKTLHAVASDQLPDSGSVVDHRQPATHRRGQAQRERVAAVYPAARPGRCAQRLLDLAAAGRTQPRR